jgi:hypothetical protein
MRGNVVTHHVTPNAADATRSLSELSDVGEVRLGQM